MLYSTTNSGGSLPVVMTTEICWFLVVVCVILLITLTLRLLLSVTLFNNETIFSVLFIQFPYLDKSKY